MRLPGIDWDEMYHNLRRSGSQFGITFGDVKLLSNSRKALEASEYARDQGKYGEFHEKVFYAYFAEMQDIGRVDVILELARSAGMDAKELKVSLEEGRYTTRLEESLREGRLYNVSAVPTFIIDEKYNIVGAQPIEVFQEALKSVEKKGQGSRDKE